ncbi:hypothetical protein C8Q73DRAFT_663692 [Cubamyces lactineus]|nr:hypothetical protein C8Q73DRAFT_663692 [Cubamyces lactineus]
MAQSSKQTNAESADAIERDGDYWFDDGNLVLIAQNHGAGARPKEFRIHIGVLARHSQTFQHFNKSVIQSTSPDSEEAGAWLSALYDGPARPLSEVPIPFSEAAALIRLGHEYETRPIMMLGLQSLFTTFKARAVWTWHSVQKGQFTPVRALGKECIEAANLFRIIDCPGLRIPALYACSAIDTKHLASGVVRADGFVEELPLDDLERCLKLRACMDGLWMDHTMDTLTLPSRQDCLQPRVCNKCVRESKPIRIPHRSPVYYKTLPRWFGPVFPD